MKATGIEAVIIPADTARVMRNPESIFRMAKMITHREKTNLLQCKNISQYEIFVTTL